MPEFLRRHQLRFGSEPPVMKHRVPPPPRLHLGAPLRVETALDGDPTGAIASRLGRPGLPGLPATFFIDAMERMRREVLGPISYRVGIGRASTELGR
jgi:hypothetical protein